MKSAASGLVCIIFLITSCASGTHISTSKNAHESTDFQNIAVYSEFPEKYEELGIVTGECSLRFTAQQDVNAALKAMKKHAAVLGANAVVIKDINGTSKLSVLGQFSRASSGKLITGIAIIEE